MLINLYPVRRDDRGPLEMSIKGSVITLDGEDFDFTPLLDGATLPRSAISGSHFDEDVSRVDGQLVMTIILPIPVTYSPEQAFPVPLMIAHDGPVALPQPLTERPAAPAEESE